MCGGCLLSASLGGWLSGRLAQWEAGSVGGWLSGRLLNRLVLGTLDLPCGQEEA